MKTERPAPSSVREQCRLQVRPREVANSARCYAISLGMRGGRRQRVTGRSSPRWALGCYSPPKLWPGVSSAGSASPPKLRGILLRLAADQFGELAGTAGIGHGVLCERGGQSAADGAPRRCTRRCTRNPLFGAEPRQPPGGRHGKERACAKASGDDTWD